jgi:ribosome maturation factor RimP
MHIDFNKIKESIEPAMSDMDIEVTNIKFRTEGKYHFLTIELDKLNGIDLDTIVDATNVINPIIDKLDMIDDTYILDVVSKERG